MATQQLTIPMFPLNFILLPGETKTLHIFEDRYKQLVSDCIDNNAHFGIPFLQNKKIADFGIEVKIIQVIKTHENGEMDIVIEALRVFRVLKYSSVLAPKLYGVCMIGYEEEIPAQTSEILKDLVREYVWISQQRVMPEDAFDSATIYSIARLVDLSEIEKYDLIKHERIEDKEQFLKPKIKLFSHLIKMESKLKSNFVLN